MISSQKLVFWGLIALVFVGGWWYLAPWDGESQTPAAEPLPAPSMSPSNQTVPGPSPTGTVVTEAPRSVGTLNWGMYSGTMQDQIQKALTDKDGQWAMNLAAKLQECELNTRQLALVSSGSVNLAGDAALQTAKNEVLQQFQRNVAACQTVSRDHSQIRRQLLSVAVDNRIVGAAQVSFAAGVLNPNVLKQMVSDARGGELSSVYYVATYSASFLSIDEETQSAVRYALKLAAEDPSVGQPVKKLLESSERTAPFLADEKTSTYDYSKISETARKEGAEIAARLVKQLMKPKP